MRNRGESAHALFKSVADSVIHAQVRALEITRNLRQSLLYKRKVERILAHQASAMTITNNVELIPGYTDRRWHQAYFNANGIASDSYIPEDVFYVSVEGKLNSYERSSVYRDKNCLDKLQLPCRFPRTVGRIVKGMFLSEEYAPVDPHVVLCPWPEVVAKPSMDSGGGRNVSFMTGNEAAEFARRCVSTRSNAEFIFQEPILQSPQLAVLGPDSVNTLRIMTIFAEGATSVVSSVLRMGRVGSRTDNITSGGLSCGIRNGRLIKQAYDSLLRPHMQHPDTGVVFNNYPVDSAEEAERLCASLHARMPELGLVSWDIAVDTTGACVVIEINVDTQSINIHQAAHGPVFGPWLASIVRRTRPIVWMNYPLS